ncbi:MAG: helix-turn-helix transcriptional regulator [Actinomycetales bacterium]
MDQDARSPDIDGIRVHSRDAQHALLMAIGSTLRSHRAQLGLSQRALAERASLPQSAIARLESGSYDPRLSWVVTALGSVGARLLVPGAAEPTRMAGEYARDEAGRRLPAHLEPYRLSEPHSWWPGQTQILMWRNQPRWSYRRVLSGPPPGPPPWAIEPTAPLPRARRSEPC